MIENSVLLNTFPCDESWKTSEIREDKEIYMESVFSRASYDRNCEHETVLIPIYFYPGETVKIECIMCNIALVFNGSPKGWARIRRIDDFMEKGAKFGAKDGSEIEIVQNEEFLEDENVPAQNGTLGDPYYYQEHGFLVIENANVFSQGVYFCYDEDSVASQRHFHILIPLIPVVHVSNDHSQYIEEISEGCSDSERNYPDHFWFMNNSAELFDDQDTCFKRNGHDDWSCYDMRTSIRMSGCENPASYCKSPLSFPTLPLGLPISISLYWSDWTDCRSHKQTRTGQCFLSLDRELAESDVLTKKWDWLKKLDRLMKNITFREGVPIFNALLASWLYNVDKIESCKDTEVAEAGQIDGYDGFFKNVFDSIFPNMTDKLETPENVFKYCFKYTKLHDNYDALLGTHTIDERAC